MLDWCPHSVIILNPVSLIVSSFTGRSSFRSCSYTTPTPRKEDTYPQVRHPHLATIMPLHHVGALCVPWNYELPCHCQYASKGPESGRSNISTIYLRASRQLLTRTEYCLPARIHGDSVRLKARSVGWSRLLILSSKNTTMSLTLNSRLIDNFTNQHKYCAILRLPAPESSRMSIIGCPVPMLLTSFMLYRNLNCG